MVNLSVSDRVHVLAPRSRTENEGAAGKGKAIAARGADIDHGGQNELGNISPGLNYSPRRKVFRCGHKGRGDRDDIEGVSQFHRAAK